MLRRNDLADQTSGDILYTLKAEYWTKALESTRKKMRTKTKCELPPQQTAMGWCRRSDRSVNFSASKWTRLLDYMPNITTNIVTFISISV